MRWKSIIKGFPTICEMKIHHKRFLSLMRWKSIIKGFILSCEIKINHNRFYENPHKMLILASPFWKYLPGRDMYVLLSSFSGPFSLRMHFFFEKGKCKHSKEERSQLLQVIDRSRNPINTCVKGSTTFVLSGDIYPVNIQLSLYARDREIVPLPEDCRLIPHGTSAPSG